MAAKWKLQWQANPWQIETNPLFAAMRANNDGCPVGTSLSKQERERESESDREILGVPQGGKPPQHPLRRFGLRV